MTRNSGNYMRGTGHHRMGSNAITDINQGGGAKKAGMPSSVGKNSWMSIYIKKQSLKTWMTLPKGYSVSQNLPVEIDPRIRMQ
jgi:hypothetical protein